MKNVFPDQKNLSGCTFPVGPHYTAMVLDMGDTYDCYVRRNVDGAVTAFLYMFGLPKDTTSYEEAIVLADANVPDYIDLFDQEE